MSEGPDAADVAIAIEEKEEPHGVTDGRCNWCGGLTQQKVRSLSENVNQLLELHQKKHETKLELLNHCLYQLEFDPSRRWPSEIRGNHKKKAALIAALKSIINPTEPKDVRNQNG